MPDRRTKAAWPWITGTALLGLAIVVAAVVQLQALPEGPQPVAWDKTPCGHCKMHVSEPPFAAQLTTTDGQVLHFDDPGCLFRYVVANKPGIHESWFHDLKAKDVWIAGNSARFVTVELSPMGYLRGAVEASAPGGAQGTTLAQELAAVEAMKPEER